MMGNVLRFWFLAELLIYKTILLFWWRISIALEFRSQCHIFRFGNIAYCYEIDIFLTKTLLIVARSAYSLTKTCEIGIFLANVKSGYDFLPFWYRAQNPSRESSEGWLYQPGMFRMVVRQGGGTPRDPSASRECSGWRKCQPGIFRHVKTWPYCGPRARLPPAFF